MTTTMREPTISDAPWICTGKPKSQYRPGQTSPLKPLPLTFILAYSGNIPSYGC